MLFRRTENNHMRRSTCRDRVESAPAIARWFSAAIAAASGVGVAVCSPNLAQAGSPQPRVADLTHAPLALHVLPFVAATALRVAEAGTPVGTFAPATPTAVAASTNGGADLKPGEPAPASAKPHVMTREEIRESMRMQLGLGASSRAIPHGPDSVKLFDTDNAIAGLELRFGLSAYRRADRTPLGFTGGGYDFQILRTTSSPSGAFFLTGIQGTHLRVLDSKSFLWSVITQELATGITLGPFELESRFGFALLNIDRLSGDGWNVSMMSPKVGANAALRIWKLRWDFGIQSEYYWRWSGPDVIVHAATIGLRLEAKFKRGDLLRPRPPGGPADANEAPKTTPANELLPAPVDAQPNPPR
jgi:hypothetical protein